MEQQDQLTALQTQAISRLLAGTPVAAVARELQIDRTTIYNWRRNHPHFAFALDQARARHNQIVYDGLQDLASTAIDTLREILTSPTAPASAKLRAVETILRATKTDQPQAEVHDNIAIEALCDHVLPVQPQQQQQQQDSTDFDTFDTPTTPAAHHTAAATKVARNEPCPCGSHLKYKRCCGNPVPRPSLATAA